MKTLIPILMGLSLLGGVVFYPSKTKSEFDVQSLNDQVQVHEQKIDEQEVKNQEQDTKLENQQAQLNNQSTQIINHERIIQQEVVKEVPVQQTPAVIPEPPQTIIITPLPSQETPNQVIVKESN